MKMLKAPIKSWKKLHFDILDNKISELESTIHSLERISDDRALNQMEMARLNAANSFLHLWLMRRERVWRQRARTYGFNMKDHNTKFFHASTTFKRKKNEITQTYINGRCIQGVANLKSEIRSYFAQRFTQEQRPVFDFHMDSHTKISEAQASLLESTPSRQEVKQAVWACGIDKAPGFDGFNFRFIREIWDVIKDEIYELVLEFFVNGNTIRHLNVTWVSLIPKVENPTSIEDYRPISMVGALYKIISKILSSRLKDVIGSLIDESQSAFVENRQILDGALIANESLTWLKKRKIPGSLIKLDFQKAYDSVNWSFLEIVMVKLGFGRKWISWIMNCVRSASMSILLNGSPLPPFKMEKGLRQGDPLSPYLFLLVSEALVYMLKKAENLNLIEPVHIGKEKVRLKHLQFADDILIFAPKNPMCIINYFRILDVFALMSGLSLNYSKSCFISWNASDQIWSREIANSVGCIHSSCPFTYLGFPLGGNMNRDSAWHPVVKRNQTRLASWKTKILSRAGRLTLIKSVLNSLPVYYLSMFKMPKSVALKIVRLQRRFFWGGSCRDKFGSPMVNWSHIQLPKELGGLGVGNILHKNLILLFKWWWRFSDSNDMLWKRILTSVYGIKGLKASSETFSRIKEGTWSQLMSNDPDTRKIRSIVEQGMIIRLGNGNSVLFWHDQWCEIGPLKRTFPRLFALSLQKNSLISMMGDWIEGIWAWNLRWCRTLYEWENDELQTLKTLIEASRPNMDMDDGVYWKHSGDNYYPTKDIVAKLSESFSSVLPKPIVNIVWHKFIPPRAKLYVWLANLEKLKTGDFLVEKGITGPQQAICPFCRLHTESNAHILFTCSFAWNTWMKILQWWGISGILHNKCSSFCIQWVGLMRIRKGHKLWGLILSYVICSIWFERNKIKFQSMVPDHRKFINSLIIRIGIWAKEMLGFTLVAPHDVIYNVQNIYMLS